VTCWILWSTKISRVSDVIVSDILDSDHLPIVFHILDHVKIRNLSEPVEKFTDWGRFQSLASELISPRIEINSGVEADKAARGFTASIASAYRLSTSKVTLLDINNDIPGLGRLLKHKRRLRKLWQETRDPGCKAAVNRVAKEIRRLTRRKALERWGTRISNTVVGRSGVIRVIRKCWSCYCTFFSWSLRRGIESVSRRWGVIERGLPTTDRGWSDGSDTFC
jgi:hypothetical protein